MDDERRLVTVGNSLQRDGQGLDKTRQDSEGKNNPRFHSAEERHKFKIKYQGDLKNTKICNLKVQYYTHFELFKSSFFSTLESSGAALHVFS